MSVSLAELIPMVLGLALTMMGAHVLGRRFGAVALSWGGKAALARLRHGIANARIPFVATEVHCCGSGAIALDDRTKHLALVSGRRLRLWSPQSVLDCRSERRRLFGWTWHYLTIRTIDDAVSIPFPDHAACTRWSRTVNMLAGQG
jgi:hypothetical protein